MPEFQDDAPAGWQFTISVPQTADRVVHHIWIVASPDQEEARRRLKVEEIPCECEALAVSSAELKERGIEPGEMRRVE
jgi:hypothetical protein